MMKPGKLVVLASSKWVLFNIATGRVSKITPEMEETYACIDKSVFEYDGFDKKVSDSDFLITTPSFEYTILERDIDSNHHVNNTNYIDYAYESIPKDVLKELDFKNIEVVYKHEAKLGETILCFYSQLETGEHIVIIKNKAQNKLHSIVRLY